MEYDDLSYDDEYGMYRDDLLEWENDRVAEDVALEQADYEDECEITDDRYEWEYSRIVEGNCIGIESEVEEGDE